MRKMAAVLIVLLIAGMAQALTTTFILSDDFAGVDLEVARWGPISAGGTFAVEYFEQSTNCFDDIEVDIGDHYVGPNLKCHFTPEGSRIDPFIGVSYLLRNAAIDNEYYVWEAGVDVYLTDNIGLGVAYASCDNFYRDDMWMLRIPVRW